jgi:hypothetical protein
MAEKPIPAPWMPVPYDEATVMAIRSFASGTANAGQQQAAYDWIVGIAAGVNEMTFHPGGPEGDRATVFAEGRRFVGNQIRKMLSPDVLDRVKSKDRV